MDEITMPPEMVTPKARFAPTAEMGRTTLPPSNAGNASLTCEQATLVDFG